MFGNNEASDATLLKVVNQKLSRGGGGSQSRISATVQRGTVTISGNLQYDAQRAPLMKQVASIAGVRRVIDQLRVTPRVNHYAAAEARVNAAVAAERTAAVNAAAKEAQDAANALEDADKASAPPSEAPAEDAPTP